MVYFSNYIRACWNLFFEVKDDNLKYQQKSSFCKPINKSPTSSKRKKAFKSKLLKGFF
jgi:hypothetical protein